MAHLPKNWNSTYMAVAWLIAEHSKAEKRKVGCILTLAGRIISTGYNGTPAGFDNVCEVNGITKPEVLHAESNAIAKCARSTESCEGADLYVTLAPCINCAKLIIQAGIRAVYYGTPHKNEGLDLLTKANIHHEHIRIELPAPFEGSTAAASPY